MITNNEEVVLMQRVWGRQKLPKRVVIVMVLPVIVLLWTIGWSLLCISSIVEPRKTKVEGDGVSIVDVGPEETYQLSARTTRTR